MNEKKTSKPAKSRIVKIVRAIRSGLRAGQTDLQKAATDFQHGKKS